MLDYPMKKHLGVNKIILCGKFKIILGCKPKALLGSFAMMNVPLTAFNIIVANPENWGDSPIVQIIGVILQLICTYFILASGIRDPGIIPGNYCSPQAKRNVPEKYRTINRKQDRILYWQVDYNHSSLHRVKWCESCNIFRPSKASHCNECNICVVGFDHHCRWMGCCVGQRNYAQFWWLVIFQIVTAAFTLTTCILHMVNNAKNKEEDQSKAAAIFNYSGVFALIGTLYSAVIVFLPGALMRFHYKLIYRNTSTNEYLKKDREVKHFVPFLRKDKAFFAKLLRIIFVDFFKQPKSLLTNQFFS